MKINTTFKRPWTEIGNHSTSGLHSTYQRNLTSHHFPTRILFRPRDRLPKGNIPHTSRDASQLQSVMPSSFHIRHPYSVSENKHIWLEYVGRERNDGNWSPGGSAFKESRSRCRIPIRPTTKVDGWEASAPMSGPTTRSKVRLRKCRVTC